MKRVFTLLLFAGVLFSGLFAKPVNDERAREIAQAFISGWHHEVKPSITDVRAKFLDDGKVAYYILNLEGEGWILISADDVVQPVLAYSLESRFLPETDWNDATRYLLNGYKDQIHQAIDNKTLKEHPGWEQLKLSSDKKSASTIIDPFIDVTWNQGSGWNMYCPEDEDGPGGHAYVGCVAVSMAQAMSVYQYPVQAAGIKSYDHDMEDPYEWGLMSNNSSNEHNARLLYHCAVAVEMGFGPNGSGAYVRDASMAMKQYFNYAQTTTLVQRLEDEQEWIDLLVEELTQHRPIIYRGEPGDGSAGHAWNVDGYGDGYFHMNFGWSGSHNGYYTLNLINPGSSDFSTNQAALIGIRPPESGPFDITLSETSVLEKLPAGSFVAAITISDEDPNNTYTYTLLGPFSFFLDKREPSKYFYIENDSMWMKEPITYDSNNPERNILIEVKDAYRNDFKKEFDIEVLKAYTGPVAISLSDSTVMENEPEGTAVGKVIVEDDYEVNNYTFTLFGPYNEAITGYDPPSFYIDEDDSLRTDVVFDYEASDSCFVMIELEDDYGNTLSRDFVIEILHSQSGGTGIEPDKPEVSGIYPNPAKNYINIPVSNTGPINVIMYDLTGKMVLSKLTTGWVDLAVLQEGIYIMVMESSAGIQTEKIVIQR